MLSTPTPASPACHCKSRAARRSSHGWWTACLWPLRALATKLAKATLTRAFLSTDPSRLYRTPITLLPRPSRDSLGRRPCWTRHQICPHRLKTRPVPICPIGAHSRQTARLQDGHIHPRAHRSTIPGHPLPSTRTSPWTSMAAHDQGVPSGHYLPHHYFRAA